jgi:cytochrome c-type biogenesis protein CcmE
MKKQVKFGIGIGVIVVSMGFLAWLGYGESKTYYHTIAEIETLKGSAAAHRIRVGGTVQPGSIHHVTGRTDFILLGEGKSLLVSYTGSDPLPDSFIDNSQALVEGRLTAEGHFNAEHIQAKCASKYEASPGEVARPSKSDSAPGRT